ncbi:PREDICTED: uncharacterized protein LOC106110605 [Papilio polytes]|uniref:uncharacterized protein LOC106110605 n=1 Tax=Papilio polytes TaxID=76194 RepID=UPI0006764365|nr:PREDICTED: uncharacterized protein LOC106110605 [Papilio polytes]
MLCVREACGLSRQVRMWRLNKLAAHLGSGASDDLLLPTSKPDAVKTGDNRPKLGLRQAKMQVSGYQTATTTFSETTRPISLWRTLHSHYLEFEGKMPGQKIHMVSGRRSYIHR